MMRAIQLREFDPHRAGRVPALASLRAPIDFGIASLPGYARLVLRLKNRTEEPVLQEQAGEPLEEYKGICEFLRLYSTLRFYQLALLLGTSGAIATVLVSDNV